MEYKNTLNLPSTSFPMKADLAKREPEVVKQWDDEKLYQKIQEASDDKPLYILHDGPPYANGSIHLGTGLNKILKDILVKSKTHAGYKVPYIPGWDCHGLPIEYAVTSKLREKKEQVSRTVIRRLCREYALKFMDIQRSEFKRLGVLGDWENPYLTLNPQYEAIEIEQFARMVERNLVYKGLKPIYWCGYCETALAEAEVDYNDHTSPSIYVKFKSINLHQHSELLSGKSYELDKPYFVVIWTTTPWTLPANLAIALNPVTIYASVDVGNEVYLIADDLVEKVMKEVGIQKYTLLGKIKGEKLELLKTRHPFVERESPILLGDHVTLEQGTGCVHTAPGHGHEDYLIGQQYGLETYSPVDGRGRFTTDFPAFAGQEVEKANKGICEMMKNDGFLLWRGDITHSYPHCWRCKHPIIYRATAQWFISLEKANLRERLLQAIDKVEWIPSYGRERIRAMVENRQEWCISRQRAWGVPIPVLYCKRCGKEYLDAGFIREVSKLVAAHGTDVWFRMLEGNATEMLPLIQNQKCKKCGGTDFTPESDILDVWFDSGISHQAVLKTRPELSFPADMYLEGSDQHRGWFQSALATAIGAEQGIPYRTVLTHGFTVDEKGRKMSKSLGNYIPLDKVIHQYGADIVRLWVASEDFREDMTVSEGILKRVAEIYRRIRNTFRFFLGNLSGFNPKFAVEEEKLFEIDKWTLMKLDNLKISCQKFYERTEFHRIFHSVNNFCTVDLSSFYLDIIKDRLYTSGPNSPDRRTAQTVLWDLTKTLAVLLNPILTFLADEVWAELRTMGLVEESNVNLLTWKSLPSRIEPDSKLLDRWNKVLTLRSEIAKALEQERKAGVIGHPLEARVAIRNSEQEFNTVIDHHLQPEKWGDSWESICIISEFSKVENWSLGKEPTFRSEEIPGLEIRVEKSSNGKCVRCWKYLPSVGSIPDSLEIWERCSTIVKEYYTF